MALLDPNTINQSLPLLQHGDRIVRDSVTGEGKATMLSTGSSLSS